MKQRNKFLLAVMLGAASISAMADGMPSTQDHGASNVANIVAPGATSQQQSIASSSEAAPSSAPEKAPEPAKDLSAYRDTESLIDPKLAAERAKTLSDAQYQIELAKLELQKATVQDQAAELAAKRTARELANSEIEAKLQSERQKADPTSADKQRIKQLSDEVAKLKDKGMPTGNLAKKIHVLKVYGLSDDLKAQVVVNDAATVVSSGDEIMPGLTVSSVAQNGIEVKPAKGAATFIPLQSIKQAVGDKAQSSFTPPPMVPVDFMSSKPAATTAR